MYDVTKLCMGKYSIQMQVRIVESAHTYVCITTYLTKYEKFKDSTFQQIFKKQSLVNFGVAPIITWKYR